MCGVCVSGGRVCPHQLSVCVVEKIQENMCVTHTLPVSYRYTCSSSSSSCMKSETLSVCVYVYCCCCCDVIPRPVSVSELISRQHLACVSNLSWSTNQQRAWAKEAELSLPGHRALPRVNLLLIGCLREGRGGEWRLMDTSGSVRCEVSLTPV